MEDKLKLEIRHYLTFVVIVLLGILIYGGYIISSLRSEKQEVVNNFNALQDTLRKSGNKYVISALKTDDINDILKIKSKDPEILQLQKALEESNKELKRLGGVITSFSNETKINKTVPTEVNEPKDSKSEKEYIYPTYKSKSEDEWYSISITSRRDSTNFDLITRGKYNVTLTSEKIKGGLFPKYQQSAFVENLSPHEETKGVRAVIIDKSKKPKLELGGHVGLGGQYGLINKKVDFGPQAGVSLNFKF